MTHRRLTGLLAGTLVLACAGTSNAAPVTVDLRIEGPTRTVFEGPVTTDVRTFRFTDDPQEITCDGGGSTPQPTRNVALATAAEKAPFTTSGTLFSFGPSFEEIGGENVAFDGATNRYLVEYKNDRVATGGCSDVIAAGDDALYAYTDSPTFSNDPNDSGTSSVELLGLSGPASAAPGAAFNVAVVDQQDGSKVAGATVGGQTTNADGIAAVRFDARGPQSLKAEAPKSVRSNRLDVCVTDGADGFCGTVRPGETTSTTAPPTLSTSTPFSSIAKITAVREGQRFTRSSAPRLFAGTVPPDPDGLRDVRLRLSRTEPDGDCTRFDGELERFVRATRCSIKNAKTFSIGADANWDYQLPARLGTGRYVLDVLTVDGKGFRTSKYERGNNRIVFEVG